MKASMVGAAASCAIALFIVCLVAGASPPPFKYTGLYCRTLINNGSPAAKADLVIVGDGYLREHLVPGGKFERDCDGFIRYFFKEPPFDKLKSLFNVHAVYLESFEGGEMVGGVRWPQMALGTKFMGRRGYIDLMSYTFKDKVETVAAHAPDYDIILVMVNVKGTGASNSIVSTRKGRRIPAPCFSADGNMAFETAVHELGHSLGSLGDEYEDEQVWDAYPLPGKGDLPFPNLSIKGCIDPSNPETIRKTAKWGHFMDLPGASRILGAYQGGYYRFVGVYRPQYTCKMRQNNMPFCYVCQESLAKAVHAIGGIPFDDANYHRENPIR